MNVKNVVVILMANPERAEELAAHLSSDTIQPIAVPTSDAMHELVGTQRVDFLVLENQLPGFLSGLQILERLYAELLRPTTILIAKDSLDIRSQARELGVDLTLPPSSTVTELVEAIEGLCASECNPQVAIPLRARKLLQQFEGIQPLPQLFVKLISHLDMEEVSTRELANDISVDPKVTADLLRLVNSSSTGVRHEITKVSDAVVLLGAKRTIALILTTGVLKTQLKLSEPFSDTLQPWYNRRGVFIASAASTFAKRLEQVSPDTAYLLGLYQDLGILVMANVFREPYMRLIDRVRKIGKLQLENIERGDFGITHADVSAALLQKWGLPQSLVAPVLYHHRAERISERPKVERPYLYAMFVAEALANLSDVEGGHRLYRLNSLLKKYGVSNVDQCKSAVAESVAKTAESSQLFDLHIPELATLETLARELSSKIGISIAAPPANETEYSSTEQPFAGKYETADTFTRKVQVPAEGGSIAAIRVCDLMSDVVEAVSAEMPALRAAQRMVQKGIRHLVVTDAFGKVSGLLSERDVLKHLSPWLSVLNPQIAVDQPIPRCDVQEIMTKQPMTVTPETTLRAAASLLGENKLGCLPVVDRHNRPLGLLSVIDILLHIATDDLQPEPDTETEVK